MLWRLHGRLTAGSETWQSEAGRRAHPPLLTEVYGSRWISQSSKLLHGGPRRRGWVRLPYASATEYVRCYAAQRVPHRCLRFGLVSPSCNIAYNIHKER